MPLEITLMAMVNDEDGSRIARHGETPDNYSVSLSRYDDATDDIELLEEHDDLTLSGATRIVDAIAANNPDADLEIIDTTDIPEADAEWFAKAKLRRTE